MQRVTVTGGAGLIGHAAAELCRHGYRVWVLDAPVGQAMTATDLGAAAARRGRRHSLSSHTAAMLAAYERAALARARH